MKLLLSVILEVPFDCSFSFLVHRFRIVAARIPQSQTWCNVHSCVLDAGANRFCIAARWWSVFHKPQLLRSLPVHINL